MSVYPIQRHWLKGIDEIEVQSLNINGIIFLQKTISWNYHEIEVEVESEVTL